MIDKKDVISFFDSLAPHWDNGDVASDDIIGLILDGANVTKDKKVLDVACGTGVLIPHYLKREVKSVTGVDISPKMAQIARSKFNNSKVEIICGDVENIKFSQKFDCIVVYNAFPHFPHPESLIKALVSLLEDGGTLTIAHGASRQTIDSHHKGVASHVSSGLMHEDELAKIIGEKLTITLKISNEKMYQVTGVL